jgi:Mn2+/Fe2+ NRAMP family transporter
VPSSSKSPFFTFKEFRKFLGPRVITRTANEDPTNVAACSQAGARFWNVIALFQLVVFQEMCARIGLVTGVGLAAAIKNKIPEEK